MISREQSRKSFIGNRDENEVAVWEITVPCHPGHKVLGLFLAKFGEAVDFAYDNGLASDGFHDMHINKVDKVNIHRISKDHLADKKRIEEEIDVLDKKLNEKKSDLENVNRLNIVSFENIKL